METWKPIPSLKGLYEASSTGKIRSLARRGGLNRLYGGKIIRQHLNRTHRYLAVGYSVDNVRGQTYAHRLVAEAFLGFAPGKEINHKDGNRQNNNISNLEWVTRSENQIHANKYIPRRPQPASRKVRLFNSFETLFFETQTKAGKAIGVCPGSISSAAKKLHKCKGYEVRYV